MNYLKLNEIQRACNLAKHLGAKLSKTDMGWLFKIEVHRRDDERLQKFQQWFYTPMSPVRRTKDTGGAFKMPKVIYTAKWEFNTSPEAEAILRDSFGINNHPIG